MSATYEHDTTCPFCSKRNELSLNTQNNRMPEAGDVSLCIGCGEWSIFDPTMASGLRKPNTSEYANIANSSHARLARETWLKVKEAREKRSAPPPEQPSPQNRLLDDAFEKLLTDVYKGTSLDKLVELPSAKAELRRIFFAGVMVVLKRLYEAHEDDTTDTICMGTLFDDLVDETNRFAKGILKGK